MENNIKPTQIIKGQKFLLLNSENKIFVRNNKITFQRTSKKYKTPLTKLYSILSYFGILKRIFRLEVSSFYKLGANIFLGVTKKEIFKIDTSTDKIESVRKIDRGSRPLNLCIDDKKNIYYGEYFSNSERQSVHIYKSEDLGNSWQRSFTFKSNEIRHIHGLFHDPFRSGIWILTGDSDKESGIWFTKDEFQSVDKILHGSQEYRAVSMFINENNLIFPMDSPLERNYIFKYDFNTRSKHQLSEIANSAFHCYYQARVYFISTVAEPSHINDEKFCYLYASIDGYNWTMILKLEQDMYSSLSKLLFRYPEIIFVPSDQESDTLSLYCRAVKKYDNSTITFSINNIKKLIK